MRSSVLGQLGFKLRETSYYRHDLQQSAPSPKASDADSNLDSNGACQRLPTATESVYWGGSYAAEC
jgi:hypothetical protein